MGRSEPAFGRPDASVLELVESTPYRLIVLVQSPSGNWVRHEIEVAADPPHKIKVYRELSFGREKPAPGMATPPPPPGFSSAPRRPPDPGFPPGEAPWEKPFSLSPAILRSYAGTYDFDSPTGLEMKVTYRDGQLFTQVPGQAEAPVFPQSETRFYAKGLVMRWVEFIKNEHGEVTGLVANSSGFEARARRK